MGNTPCDGDGDDFALFSEDVYIQILSWLPVISLLRFKSVCKSWRALIQSTFFIDLHTFNSSSSSSSSKFGTFILQAIQLADKNPLDAEIKSFMVSSESDEHAFKVDNLGFSPFFKDFHLTNMLRIVGSCNGLICLHDSKLKLVSLWNPATRQFRILPKSITIEDKRFSRDFVLFGFDVKTKDYKVVWTSRDRQRGLVCACRVQVYSLSTDSWRLLEGIISLSALPYDGPYMNHGIYLNGSYFFVGTDIAQNSISEFREDGTLIPRNNISVMLSFDFTKEIFTTMQFPAHDCRHTLVLSYLGEKTALFIARKTVLAGYESCCKGEEDYDYYDIWVLNEHRSSIIVNKDCWTQLHSFRIANNRTQPRCISNNGEFALISIKTGVEEKLQWFNLVTKEAKIDFKICDGVVNADVYKESLVSIMGANGGAAAAATSPTNSDRVVCCAM